VRAEEIVSRLQNVTSNGDGQSWKACCPAHEDSNPSLSVTESADGRTLVYCHKGCETDAVVSAMGLEMRDLFANNGNGNGHHATLTIPDNREGKALPPPSYPSRKKALEALDDRMSRQGMTRMAVWRYFRGDDNKPVAVVARYDGNGGGKTFRPLSRWDDGWRACDPEGKWVIYIGKSPDADRYPLLPDEGQVYVTEGEKCADLVAGLGLVAVASAHGAKSAAKTDWSPLAGREVAILPDNDGAGRKYADQVAGILLDLEPPAKVKVVKLTHPGMGKGDDIEQWAGHYRRKGDGNKHLRDRLQELVSNATQYVRPQAQVRRPPPSGSAVAKDGIPDLLSPEGRSDLANAWRLARDHGNKMRWCKAWGEWLIWDNTRWKIDDTYQAEGFANETAYKLFEAMPDVGRTSPQMLSQVGSFCRSSISANGNAACLKQARTLPDIAITHDQLDRDPMALNVLNGTIDLRTGQLRKHDRKDLFTKLVPVEYDPNAKCPRWEKSLLAMMDGDQELVEYLKRVVGYSLTGDCRERVMWVLHGEGRNGKSLFIGTLLKLLGDYGWQANAEMLTVRRHEAHPTERADLFGRRLVAASETESGARLAESLVKHLTGQDKITARRVHENFWTFDPTHKILLATNHKPVIRGTDNAIWDRLILVPFGVRFWDKDRGEDGPAGLEADKKLSAKLEGELPGILAWAVRGCLEWQRDGLRHPKAVRAATDEYRKDEDKVEQFLAEQCVRGEGEDVRSTKLYEAYKKWSGDHAMTQKALAARLRAKGLEHEKRRKIAYWCGVSLVSEGSF
jgi:putative DNA primase/helicase